MAWDVEEYQKSSMNIKKYREMLEVLRKIEKYQDFLGNIEKYREILINITGHSGMSRDIKEIWLAAGISRWIKLRVRALQTPSVSASDG
jgi:hypothetical protein